MAKTQFAYRDAHGVIYPAHPALLAQPGLVPGTYDTETRIFTPTGNPLEQTGNIVTDAGVGVGREQVLSGLRDDKGAGTAPIQHGVAFTQPADPDMESRVVDLESQLAESNERNAALEARLAVFNQELGGAQPAAEAGPAETGAADDSAHLDGGADQTDSPAPAPRKRGRKPKQ